MKSVVRLFAMLVSLCAAGIAGAAENADSFAIDRVLGKADAPITIIEYASTTCSHCADLHTQIMPQLKAEWIDTGKARLIFRDFPTSPANLSLGASMIAHCAGPERYFGVLSMLFEQQDKWLGSQNPLDALKKLVRLAGMTGEDVDACIARKDLLGQIQDRARVAQETYKIHSTPTLIVNGTKIEGANRDLIEKALKDAVK